MTSLVFPLALFFVLLPWGIMFVLYVNRGLEVYRTWKRSGRAVEEWDGKFLELCKVFAMIALWLFGFMPLKGW
jgi:hypothetical protein